MCNQCTKIYKVHLVINDNSVLNIANQFPLLLKKIIMNAISSYVMMGILPIYETFFFF